MFSRHTQFLNVELSIFAREIPSVTSERFLHPSKADVPSVVTLSGTITVLSNSQVLNAEEPMVLTDFPILRSTSFLTGLPLSGKRLRKSTSPWSS